MSLKGNLSAVSLSEIFNVLSHSTGLLRIQAPDGPRYVEIKDGAISIAGRSAGRIMLGDLMLSRGYFDETQLAAALKGQKESGKLLGQTLIDMGLVTPGNLESALKFQIEEEVCELFTLKSGDFDFLPTASLDATIAPGGGMVRFMIDPMPLMAEAARRVEEWAQIESRMPSQALIFALTDIGKQALQNSEGVSAEGQTLLRLVAMSRTVETMVLKGCLGRLTTNIMLLELLDAGLIEPVLLSKYAEIAKKHLSLNRVDEAQRVAKYLLSAGNSEEQEDARAVLRECDRGTETGSKVLGVPGRDRRHSEVIRRPAPSNLILKKERSSWPMVVVILLVLAGLGGGAYYNFFYKKTGAYSASRRSLDEMFLKSNELANQGNYEEALQILREFKSSDPDVQKLAKERFDHQQEEFERKLMQAIREFDTATAGGDPEAIKSKAAALERYIHIGVSASEVESERTRALQHLEEYEDRKRVAQFKAQLKPLEEAAAADAKGKEALLKAYQEILSQNPPEEIASTLREQLAASKRGEREGARLINLAKSQAEAGLLQFAKESYGRAKVLCAGTPLTADVESGETAVEQRVTEAQQQLEKLDQLRREKKTEELKTALNNFINSHPPQDSYLAVSQMWSELNPDGDAQASVLLKSAETIAASNPSDSRAKIGELVQKYPFSRSALKATLPLKIESFPPDADVQINRGRSVKTPVVVNVSAYFPADITVKKSGFQSYESVQTGIRSESLSIDLDRTPVAVRRLPASASGGLAVAGEQLVVAYPGEIAICNPQDLKVIRRVKLERSGTAPHSLLPSLICRQGQAFVASDGKILFRSVLTSFEVKQIVLEQNAKSPVYFLSGGTIAIETQSAFELREFDKGALKKVIPLPNEAGGNPCTDGETLFVPRKNVLYAVNPEGAEAIWSRQLDATIAGPVAFIADKNRIACIDEKGKLSLIDAHKGDIQVQHDFAQPSSKGCLALKNGLVVVTEDKGTECTMHCVDSVSANPLWSTKLNGTPVLPAVLARQSLEDAKFLVLATSDKDTHTLYTIQINDGQVIWFAHPAEKITAIATDSDGQNIFISTADGDISMYRAK